MAETADHAGVLHCAREGATHLFSLGKWYDPISERWIEPRRARLEAALPTPAANYLLDLQTTVEVKRIWRALVDCCTHD